MQIKYFTKTTLAEYIEKASNAIWAFPDFFEKCPIYSAKNCAVKIGVDRRSVFCFELNKKYRIPYKLLLGFIILNSKP